MTRILSLNKTISAVTQALIQKNRNIHDFSSIDFLTIGCFHDEARLFCSIVKSDNIITL